VVAGDEEFELRRVVEEVLAHEPRRDDVATGQPLDARFRPAASLLGFGRGYKARAAEARQVGRMAIAVARCECLNWRSAVIIAQDARDRQLYPR
jgi:hypothetical protein